MCDLKNLKMCVVSIKQKKILRKVKKEKNLSVCHNVINVLVILVCVFFLETKFRFIAHRYFVFVNF